MMYQAHYELPHVKPFARILGVIPISSEQRPREMIKALQTASDAIRAGEVVCIFAEDRSRASATCCRSGAALRAS